MAERLILCGACGRHMKSSEGQCPFCGETALRARPSVGEPFLRMATAAAVVAGVASVTGCSDSNSSGVVFYGAPLITDAGSDSSTATDASVVVFYGAPNLGTDATAPNASDASDASERDASTGD
jgi:hypothetical protein